MVWEVWEIRERGKGIGIWREFDLDPIILVVEEP
jgi:hypothetical protein